MPWDVNYLEAEYLVIIQNSGELTNEDFIAETTEAWRVMRQHHTYACMVDNRNYHHPFSLIDLYELPIFFDKIGVDRRVRVALLFNQGSPLKDDVRFFETVCINQGYNFKVFYEESEAKSWLKKREY